MPKKTVYTRITPLPSHIPRQLALDLLHNHPEVCALNPLVTGVQAITAPRTAPNDEYFSSWYEISEIITWGLGIKKKISFKGVFHDQPYGLQSHIYAPMGVELRNKYRVGGNQPGEPPEVRELGVDTPREGLYLREDHEITCNMALAGFVKKEMKDATGKMFERMIRKAELVDEGKLHAMFENGMLKTAKPGQFDESQLGNSTSHYGSPPGTPGMQPPPSPSMSVTSFASGLPPVHQQQYGKYHEMARSSSSSTHRNSQYIPQYQQNGYAGPQFARPGAELTASPIMPVISELPGNSLPLQHPGLLPKPQVGPSFRAELAGDSTYVSAASPQPSPRPVNRSPGLTPEPKANGRPQQQTPQQQQYQQSQQPTQQQRYQQPQQQQQQQQPQHHPQQTHQQQQYNSYRPTPQAQTLHPADRDRAASISSSSSPNANPYTQSNSHSPDPSARTAHRQPSQTSLHPQNYSRPSPTAASDGLGISKWQSSVGAQRPPSTVSDISASSYNHHNGGGVNYQSRANAGVAGNGESGVYPPTLTPPQAQTRRFSQVGVLQPPPKNPARNGGGGGNGMVGGGGGGVGVGGAGSGSTAKCPVCGLFEGDEAAVNYHVARAHFS